MYQLITLLMLITVSNLCSAKSFVYKDVKDLNSVKEHIKLGADTKKSTLIIFDIDDTLLEATNFVGSNKWYNWQRGKVVHDLNGKPFTIQNKNKFSCIFRTLGTMFELGTSQLTQQDAAQVVNELKPYDLMLLTSRTTKYREATERELNKNGINLSTKHLMKKNAVLAFNFDDQKRVARVTYENGIVMSSGLNKGLVLKSILKKLDKSYQRIYFIDDSPKNISNMEEEWQNNGVEVNILHYTRVDKSISKKEVKQSIAAKKYFDEFLSTAYPDRFNAFQSNQCM